MTTAIEKQQNLPPHKGDISYGRLIKKELKCSKIWWNSSYSSFQSNGYSPYMKYEKAKKKIKIA